MSQLPCFILYSVAYNTHAKQLQNKGEIIEWLPSQSCFPELSLSLFLSGEWAAELHLNCWGHHNTTKDTFSDSTYPFHNPKPMHLQNKNLFFTFLLCFSSSPNLALHKHGIVYCKHCQLCDKLLMLRYWIKASVKCINVNRKFRLFPSVTNLCHRLCTKQMWGTCPSVFFS